MGPSGSLADCDVCSRYCIMYNVVVSLFQDFLLLVVVMLHVSLVSIKSMCACVVVESDFTPLEPCRVASGVGHSRVAPLDAFVVFCFRTLRRRVSLGATSGPA